MYVPLPVKPALPNDVSDIEAMSFVLLLTSIELLLLLDGGGGRPGGAFETPNDGGGCGGLDGEDDAGL